MAHTSMTRKLCKPRHTRSSPGNPLFGNKDYPLISTVDPLISLSKSVESHPFRFLLWTEDKKGFHKYQGGRTVTEIDFGYST